jgi:predicted DNA binding CopG/RHH family protein
MNKEKRKVPRFRSQSEEAKYWDEHSLTEHLDEFQPAGQIRFVRPIKRLISMRYDVTLLRQIRTIAARKGIPYQTLIHLWLTERTNEELTLAAHAAPRRRTAGAGARV